MIDRTQKVSSVGGEPQEPFNWEQPSDDRDLPRRWPTRWLVVAAVAVLLSGVGMGWVVRGIVAGPSPPPGSAEPAPVETPPAAGPTVSARQPEPATVRVTWPESVRPVVGDEFTVVGETSANLVGATVHLQTRDSGTWNTLSRATVATDATFVLTTVLRTAGADQEYRVHAPETDTTTETTSEVELLDVYRWYDLAAMSWSDTEGHGHAGAGWEDPFTGTVNAQTFQHALALNTHSSTGWVAVDLQRKCVQFRSTAGWSDTSPTWGDQAVADLQGELRVFADEVEIGLEDEIRFGESRAVVVDVDGALRLRVEAAKFVRGRQQTTESGYLVVGDPQFLCLF